MGKNKNRGTVINNVAELNLDGLTVDAEPLAIAKPATVLELPASQEPAPQEIEAAPKAEAKVEVEVKIETPAPVKSEHAQKFEAMITIASEVLSPENALRIAGILLPLIDMAKGLFPQATQAPGAPAAPVTTATTEDLYNKVMGITPKKVDPSKVVVDTRSSCISYEGITSEALYNSIHGIKPEAKKAS